MPTTHRRTRTLAAALAAGAALLLTAQPAAARAPKPAGPALVLETKTCDTGTTTDRTTTGTTTDRTTTGNATTRTGTTADRAITITARATLRDTGTDLQLRFTVQQRPGPKTTWRSVFAKTGDLGTWTTSEPGADILRYTKTINGLAEGTHYRVLVDARATTGGKVVTRTTRRTYTCIQPQITPRLQLLRVAELPTDAATPTLRVTTRNAGRDDSGQSVLTAQDPATGTILGQRTIDTIPGRTTRHIELPITACPGTITVTIATLADESAAVTPEQRVTYRCGSAKLSARATAKRRAR